MILSSVKDVSAHRHECVKGVRCQTPKLIASTEQPSAAGIAVKAADALFRDICMNPNHHNYSLLPRLKQHQFHMRTRAHNSSLPPTEERNFLFRNLYYNNYLLTGGHRDCIKLTLL